MQILFWSGLVLLFFMTQCNGLDLKPTSQKISVGIFLDSENLSKFLKAEGGRQLVDWAAGYGNPIVRRAYGDWSLPGLNIHQRPLITSGFKLVHSPHLVSGKNSADIAMVIDIMETAQRKDLDFFMIATGDSDFSCLFCHLRDAGRMVIGVGPHSLLSEAVKSSADHFIYTDVQDETQAELPCVTNVTYTNDRKFTSLEFERAVLLLKRALETVESEGGMNPGLIKSSMLQIDRLFDHRALGFESFREFLVASDLVHVQTVAYKKLTQQAPLRLMPGAPVIDAPWRAALMEPYQGWVSDAVRIWAGKVLKISTIAGSWHSGHLVSESKRDSKRPAGVSHKDYVKQVLIGLREDPRFRFVGPLFWARENITSFAALLSGGHSTGQGEACKVSAPAVIASDKQSQLSADVSPATVDLLRRALDLMDSDVNLEPGVVKTAMCTLDSSFDLAKTGFTTLKKFMVSSGLVVWHDLNGKGKCSISKIQASLLLHSDDPQLQKDRFDRAVELLRRVLKFHDDSTPLNPLLVKRDMRAADSSFHQQTTGFATWQEFLLTSGLVVVRPNILVEVKKRQTQQDILFCNEGQGSRGVGFPGPVGGYHAALLQRALYSLESSQRFIDGETIANAIQRIDPTFDHVAAGYCTFAEFVAGSGWAVRHTQFLYKALPHGLGD
jgi:uncharacterized LabA/DUF88 family protein